MEPVSQISGIPGPLDRTSTLPLNFVFGGRRLLAAEVDMVPNPFVQEIEAQLDNGIGNARAGREFPVTGEKIEDEPSRQGTEDSVANGLGDTSAVGIHANWNQS